MTYSASSWNIAGTQTGVIGGTALPTIDISGMGSYGMEKKFPNKKISINVHEAHGGYIVEVVNTSLPGELYIISDDKDLGSEIGKIITHTVLKEKHE